MFSTIRRGALPPSEAQHPAPLFHSPTSIPHSESPKPFIWTARATDILEKVKRGRRALHTRLNEAQHYNSHYLYTDPGSTLKLPNDWRLRAMAKVIRVLRR